LGFLDAQLSTEANTNALLSPSQQTQFLLADLAIIWNDYPNKIRAVAFAPANPWMPSTQFLDHLFTGLATSPLAQTITTKAYFDLPRDKTSVKLKKSITSFSSDEISEIKNTQATVTLVNGITEKAPIDYSAKLFQAEGEATQKDVRKKLLNDIATSTQQILSGIHLPKERNLRLTSQTGQIPISVQNDSSVPLHVRVKAISDKLLFPNGDHSDITIDRQNYAFQLPIRARTSGIFPLKVQIESPTTGTILATTTITVNANNSIATGNILSIGAVAFLLGWWAYTSIKSRKQKIPLKKDDNVSS
jgi:hypothetical protein